MPIPLRSPDVVRRIADRFDYYVPHWPHHKRLLALAAMYGYSSWETLVAACNKSAPAIVFDQDLPTDEARQRRWLEMAQNVSETLSMLLPDAINLVRSVVPTMQIGIEMPKWYEPNDVFDRALMIDLDVWWVCVREVGNPLVPPGFVHANANRIADIAQSRLKPNSERTCPTISILLPHDLKRELRHPHVYFRRGEFLEIQPIPLGDALRSPRKFNRYLRDFFDENYANLDKDQREELLSRWTIAMKTLLEASGLKANSKRRWVQVTVSTRAEMNRDCFWPLITISEGEPNERALEHAMRVDAEVKTNFGGNPGWIHA